MRSVVKLFFSIHLYISARILLFKYKIPYRYVKLELNQFLYDPDSSIAFLEDTRIKHTWLIFLIECDFIPNIINTRLVEKKKFEETINNIFD